MYKCILALVFILSSTATHAAAPASDDAQIRAQIDGWLEAWNREDAEAVASYYSEDADWTHAHGGVRSGKTEIYAQYKKVFSAALPDGVKRALSFDIITIRMITDGVAVVDGEYEYSGLLAAPDLKGKGRQTLVMKKQDGVWLRAAQRNWIPMTRECLELMAER